MGTSQSIPSTSEIKDAPVNKNEEYSTSTMNGQKNLSENETTGVASAVAEEPTLISTDGEEEDDHSFDSSKDEYDSDDDDDDDVDIELDEAIMERRMILEETRKLRAYADYFYSPQKPVTVDATACARNYFTRYSAPEQLSLEDEEEHDVFMADALALKKFAIAYLHPERPVHVTDPTACGRNYFTRPSAPEYEDEDTMDVRDQVLADAAALKQVADWYMHPEKPVSVDSAACGRNYFTRPSAPEYEGEEEMEEHDRILLEVSSLKRLANWYLHPEKPVVSDCFVCGRNYFSRPSAPEVEEEDDMVEREHIISEAKKLKEVAEWYHHPEKPVVSDGFSSGRNYFSRPSAPGIDSEERERILADAKQLKKIAEWYHFPEKPVEVDPTAYARNYFSRPSAPEQDDDSVAEERNLILQEAIKLKEVAEWYHYPEISVNSSIAVTRNFFSRPSAQGQYESLEEEEERARILIDAQRLKKLAVDYLHPENPVLSNGSCARNYFDRASAPDHADHIHTQGHAIEGDQDEYLREEHHDAHHDYYHHHSYDYAYHHHDDDQSHHTQSDHFEMDEDMFQGFRESLNAVQQLSLQHVPIIKEVEGDEKDGHLSRSPSDVMLFDEAAI